MQELPKNKVISSLREINREVVPMPMAVIYKNPADFPKGCVARVFDAKTGRPTSLCILRKTVQECREDVQKSGFYIVSFLGYIQPLSILQFDYCRL